MDRGVLYWNYLENKSVEENHHINTHFDTPWHRFDRFFFFWIKYFMYYFFKVNPPWNVPCLMLYLLISNTPYFFSKVKLSDENY